MRLKLPFLFIFTVSGMLCFAQAPARNGSATAYSQIHVRIPSVAIINLAKNRSTAVAYKSPAELKKSVKINPPSATVTANSEWSVNVIKEQNSSYTSAIAEHANASPSLTVIYVTTRN